jgi:hypothetical protein
MQTTSAPFLPLCLLLLAAGCEAEQHSTPPGNFPSSARHAAPMVGGMPVRVYTGGTLNTLGNIDDVQYLNASPLDLEAANLMLTVLRSNALQNSESWLFNYMPQQYLQEKREQKLLEARAEMRIRPMPSDADALNGVQWKGNVVFHPTVYRVYEPATKVWGIWQNTSQGLFYAGGEYTLGLTVEKTKGGWTVNSKDLQELKQTISKPSVPAK